MFENHFSPSPLPSPSPPLLPFLALALAHSCYIVRLSLSPLFCNRRQNGEQDRYNRETEREGGRPRRPPTHLAAVAAHYAWLPGSLAQLLKPFFYHGEQREGGRDWKSLFRAEVKKLTGYFTLCLTNHRWRNSNTR